VAFVQDLVSSWRRGDSAAVRAAFDPLIEGHAAEEAGCRIGIDAVMALLEEWRDTFDDFTAESVKFVSAGDSVVVHYRFHGRNGGTGAIEELDETQIYRLLNRRVIAIHEYRAIRLVGMTPNGARSR
jgi:hypothetical protein